MAAQFGIPLSARLGVRQDRSEVLVHHRHTNSKPIRRLHWTTYTIDEVLGADEEKLGLYAWNGEGWMLESSSQVNAASSTVTAMPDHFSYWAVLAGAEVQE